MIGFVVFSLKRAWQGFWRNAVMSIAATATMILMLLLLAGFWILQTGLFAQRSQFVEQKVEVVADVHPNAASLTRSNALAERDRARCPRSRRSIYVSRGRTRSRASATRLRGAGPRGPDEVPRLATRCTAASRSSSRDAAIFGSVVEVLRSRTEVVAASREIQKLVDEVLTITGILRTAGIVMLGAIGLTVLFIVSTRSGSRSSRAPTRSRSCAWSARPMASSAGRSCSRVRSSACFGAAITLGPARTRAAGAGRRHARRLRVLPTQFGDAGPRPRDPGGGDRPRPRAFGSWLSVRSYLIR